MRPRKGPGVTFRTQAGILSMEDYMVVDHNLNLTGLGLEVQKLEESGVSKGKAIAMVSEQYFKDLRVKNISRAQGCLMGQLVGDSLGSLVEFQTPAQIRQDYPDGVRDLADGGPFQLIAGQPTDDSEMALALARSLVEHNGYDKQAVRRAYVQWIQSGPFDCGPTIAGALRGHMNPDSQANGAMMRVSPLGIWGARNFSEDGIDHWAEEDALITHPNPVCVDANILFARAIGDAIRNPQMQGERYPGPDQHGYDPQIPLEVYELYSEIESWAECAESAVEETVKAARNSPPPSYTRQMGWVLIAFHNALYQLLHAHSFEEALVDTVMRGGDTDTNAAICGALLGAVYGLEAIPARWREAVLNCRPSPDNPRTKCPRPECYWPVDALTLAQQLLGE
ncbi:MAG: ADP-ribosylglycohydrolase family protein [Synergistaceae bacterium]|nr:ADP-ribosylglycohydrolase family protein [Synergistaceae bacterium]